MTALTLHDDFLAMRARFHRALAISVGVHALLALGLLLADEAHPDLPRIIEVTWLEPVDVPEPAPVAVTPREVRPAEPPSRPGNCPSRAWQCVRARIPLWRRPPRARAQRHRSDRRSWLHWPQRVAPWRRRRRRCRHRLRRDNFWPARRRAART
jgi:hypothetical protein